MYDSIFNYKGEFRTDWPSNPDPPVILPFTPGGICLNGTSEQLYIACSDDARIFVYSYTGTLIDSIEDPTIQEHGVIDLEVINNSLHVLTGGDSVISFNNEGNRKAAWHADKGQCLADGGAGKVVVGQGQYNTPGQICRYDSAGNMLSSIQVEGAPTSVAVDTMKQHLYVLIGGVVSFKLLVFDSTEAKINQYVPNFSGNYGSKQTMRLLENGNPLVMYSERLLELSAFNKSE